MLDAGTSFEQLCIASTSLHLPYGALSDRACMYVLYMTRACDRLHTCAQMGLLVCTEEIERSHVYKHTGPFCWEAPLP